VLVNVEGDEDGAVMSDEEEFVGGVAGVGISVLS